MRLTKKKTIRGLEVETTQLPVMRSLGLSARWMRILTPGLGVLAPLILKAAGKDAESTSAIAEMMSNTSTLGASLAALFSSTAESEIAQLSVDTLVFTVVMYEGKRVPLDSKAAIDTCIPTLKDLVEILSFVLGVNYDNFFVDEPLTRSD